GTAWAAEHARAEDSIPLAVGVPTPTNHPERCRERTADRVPRLRSVLSTRARRFESMADKLHADESTGRYGTQRDAGGASRPRCVDGGGPQRPVARDGPPAGPHTLIVTSASARSSSAMEVAASFSCW